MSQVTFSAAVVTLSDKAAAGERADKSGEIIKQMLIEAGYLVEASILLPDVLELIKFALEGLSERNINLIITTGGTGFSKRDVTPEATLAIAHRNAPGIAEAIRHHSLSITGRAMLSRGVAVIRGSTLIVNLPGSPKAVKESLEYILPHLRHGIEILSEKTGECGGHL